MKILLSADCFFPAPMGGPSNSIYWQAKALVRAGHDVTVIATSQDLPSSVPLNQWLAMDCGRVMYTRNPHFYLPLTHIWQGWRAIPKADIVHVNSLFYPASLVWVLLSRLAGKPVIWSPHGELNPVALSIRPQIKNLMLALIKRIIDPAVQFQAASPTEAAHIRQCFGPATPRDGHSTPDGVTPAHQASRNQSAYPALRAVYGSTAPHQSYRQSDPGSGYINCVSDR